MPFKPALNEQERWARSLADMTAGTEMALYLIQNLGALLLTLIVLRGMLHAVASQFLQSHFSTHRQTHQSVTVATARHAAGERTH
jgi:putative effector of murein hydrolase